MWQVKLKKAWFDMDASVHEAHQRGESTVVFSELNSARKDLWSQYSIDFEKMERTNIESKIVRPVRWTGAPFNIDSAPGAESALPAIASSSTALAICDVPVDPLPLPRPAAADAEPR